MSFVKNVFNIFKKEKKEFLDDYKLKHEIQTINELIYIEIKKSSVFEGQPFELLIRNQMLINNFIIENMSNQDIVQIVEYIQELDQNTPNVFGEQEESTSIN